MDRVNQVRTDDLTTVTFSDEIAVTPVAPYADDVDFALPDVDENRGGSVFSPRITPRQNKSSPVLETVASIPDLKRHLRHLETQERVNSIRLAEAMANANGGIVISEALPSQKPRHDKDQKQRDQEPRLKRRCLALISHNNMKPAMQEFVIAHKHILKHFRLTGTNSTMTMLGQVFKGMDVQYGPTMSSGPLGGDAQVAALLTRGDLGGMIFFADPLSAHPHIADVHSLIRLANVHDILYACNRTTARAMIMTLKLGLDDPSIIPSFYNTLESPSVAKYRSEQKALVEMLKERQIQLEFAKAETLTIIARVSRPLASENLEKTVSDEILKASRDFLSPRKRKENNAPADRIISKDSHLTKKDLDELAGELLVLQDMSNVSIDELSETMQ